MTKRQGFQLVEQLLVAALISLVTILGVPPLLELSRGLRVYLAANELLGILRSARSYAIRDRRNVAVKFRVGDAGVVTYALYRDGDGDGVRNADIDSGVDPQVTPVRSLSHLGRRVRFGFPPGTAPRDPGDPRQRLGRLEDPIRFNRSDLASFSPLGESTPGSLYLTDGGRHLAAVRVFHRTGKVKILTYDFGGDRWR